MEVKPKWMELKGVDSKHKSELPNFEQCIAQVPVKMDWKSC